MNAKPSKLRAGAILSAGFAAGIFFYWTLLRAFHHCLQSWSDPAHAGQFGDYVGGILNPFIGLLALVAASLAAWFTYKGLRLAQRQSEQRMSVDMYELWTSADMASDREKAIAFLLNKDLTKFDKDSPLKIGHWAYPGPESGDDPVDRRTISERYYQILRVFEYLCAVESLARTRTLDIELFAALTGGQIAHWLDVFERISFVSGHDDGNPLHNDIAQELNRLGRATHTRISGGITSLKSRLANL